MTGIRRTLALALAVALGTGGVAAGPGLGAREGSPIAALAVRGPDGWATWWRQDEAPVRWNGDALLAEHVSWRPGSDGVEWGELQLRGASEAWRTRVVVARIDPRRIALSLATAFAADQDWAVRDEDRGVAVALDAGQFRGSLPWGWVVHRGRELLAPQYAPLAGAVVVDASGAVRLIPPEAVPAERARGSAREAFQSYPMLLHDGAVPAPLLESGRGVDLGHRDARLALGSLSDGRMVVALTRFDGLGGVLDRVPFGLTSPEMAAVMGALGCREALLLDGGISGQLLLRDAAGAAHVWSGVRRVPLGLVGRPISGSP
jgi:hypothetical protein